MEIRNRETVMLTVTETMTVTVKVTEMETLAGTKTVKIK